MSGIIVGVDGSGHSQRALEWAMHEAAVRHEPLTVLTVHEAVRGYYSGMAVYPDDPARTEEARVAAQAETSNWCTDRLHDGAGENMWSWRTKLSA